MIGALRGRCHKRVVQVSAGTHHSVVLMDSGEVLTFGDGGFGALGHGDCADQLVPKVVESLGIPPMHVRVLEVAAGLAQTVLLAEGGQVVTWGDEGSDESDDEEGGEEGALVDLGDGTW